MNDKGSPSFCSFSFRPHISFCEHGKLTRPEYRDKVEKNGVISVECIGDFDLDGLIQSSRDECLIYNILERSISDPSVLERFKGSFADVVADQVPFSEHLQRYIDLQRSFDNLDPQLRQLFDGDIHTFISSLQDGSADSRVKSYIQLHSDKFIAPSSSVSNSESNKGE